MHNENSEKDRQRVAIVCGGTGRSEARIAMMQMLLEASHDVEVIDIKDRGVQGLKADEIIHDEFVYHEPFPIARGLKEKFPYSLTKSQKTGYQRPRGRNGETYGGYQPNKGKGKGRRY